jgi:replicative DNA helicase
MLKSWPHDRLAPENLRSPLGVSRCKLPLVGQLANVLWAGDPSRLAKEVASGQIDEFIASTVQDGFKGPQIETDCLLQFDAGRHRNGFLSERDFPSLTSAASRLAAAKLFIDDSPGLSIAELRAKARRLVASHQVQLLVIDYLQLLRSTSRRAQDNRQIEISEISAGIKSLAKELNIPIIVIAQLNRQPDARAKEGGRPRLSDLRESGSIEQDADVVGLLIRSEYYETDEEAKQEKAGEAELIIAKQRNGPTGDVPLTFLKEYTRFENRAREQAQ